MECFIQLQHFLFTFLLQTVAKKELKCKVENLSIKNLFVAVCCTLELDFCL